MKLKLAAIGVRHGHCWGMIEGFLKTRKVKLVGIAEDHAPLRKQAAKRLPGVSLFIDWRRCLDEVEPDIITLVTRNHVKQRVLCECFARGIGVFADKPVFTEQRWLTRAEAMWKKAREKPALSALLGLRCSPAGLALKQLVSRGELGDIVHIYKCRPHRLRPRGRQPWELNNRENGGVVMDLASHDVDYARWLIDSEPEEVMAYAGLARFKRLKGFWDNGQVTVRFKSGATLMVEADWLTPEKSAYHGDCRAMVTGTEGFAEVLEHLNLLKVTTFRRPERTVKLPKRTFNLYEDFLAQREGCGRWLTAPEIFRLHHVLISADRSARQGGRKISL